MVGDCIKSGELWNKSLSAAIQQAHVVGKQIDNDLFERPNEGKHASF